jgi:fibronectin-binding autotransporter adhesin
METYRQRRGGYASPSGYNASDAGTTTSGEGYDEVPISPRQVVDGATLVWTRAYGLKGRETGKTSSLDIKQEFETWTLRSGVDGVFYDDGDQSFSIGINGLYGQNRNSVTSKHGDGTIETTGWGVGGSATWRGMGGVYVDAQVQALFHESDVVSEQLGVIVEGNPGKGYSAGIEVGGQIALGGGFFVTPQLQLSYARADFDNFIDKYQVSYLPANGGRMTTRLGVSADYQSVWIGSDGDRRSTQTYGIANIYYHNGSTSVDVSSVTFEHERHGAWASLGFGGSYSWFDDLLNLEGEVNVRTAFEEMGKNNMVSGVLRGRVRW